MSAAPLPVSTPRLRLRRLDAGDLQAFQACRSDPEPGACAAEGVEAKHAKTGYRREAPTSPGLAPWAQEVMPGGAGFSRVAADVLLPPTLLGRYQGWQATDDAAALAFLLDMASCDFCAPGRWFQLGIARRDDDRLVGDIGIHLHADGRSAEIGFTLSRAAQGQGLATEAVRAALDLIWAHTTAQRVLGVADTRNAASLRLLQRVGLRPFSTLAAVFRGEPCEEQSFVRYRDDPVVPVLRPALASDAGDVARVLIDARRELMPFAPSAHGDDEVRAWVREVLIPTRGVTVACIGGAVAGVLAVSQADGTAWIEQLSVHPSHVARGAGSALLAHALSTLPRPLQLYTFQANRHARCFYERHGFSAVAFSDGATNEERCPDVLYRLDAGGPALRSPA